jgi:uncharacterized protein (TIGR04141 family)
MDMPLPRTNTFSLYLAKSNVGGFDELLTDTARNLIDKGRAQRTTADNFADGNALFVFPGRTNIPKWVEQLQTTFTLPGGLFSQSPCAILAFRKGEHIFAVTFSYAHVYLDDAKTEADFGLKVAINAVSDEKLRSVERSNIGAAIRDFAQAAGQRDLRSFGFDDALDLIRKVSGHAADGEFADMVTGSRALRFSKKMEIADVPDAATEALPFFRSRAYKDTHFKIIDFLVPVLDVSMQERLDDALVMAIRKGSDEFEIAIPAILSETVGSFRFEHASFSRFYPDLSLELYREGLGDRLRALTVEDLKRHSVAAYSENEDGAFDSWSVHDALVGSLVLGAERYALNEGSWYRIDRAFKDSADQKFVDLCGKPDKKLRPLRKVAKAGGKGTNPPTAYQSEESYNMEMAAETGYLLMDQKLVKIDDVTGRGIEACDLLDITGHRFIHVKKSSRQSSVLSHFFKQGSNAAQMMRRYEPFNAEMINVVRREHGAKQARALEAALKDRWTVEFQIADYPRLDKTHNIPFFSKLTLREEARNIESMGFDVRVGFITLMRIEQAVAKPKSLKRRS